MSASIDTTGLAKMTASVRRAVTGDLQAALVKNIHDSGPDILADIQGQASTRIQRHAAASVVARRDRDGIELEGGARGDALDRVLFDGGEYGGRKSKRVTYATRSPAGRAYVVRRRTTMQFLPHLGRDGYLFWPTVREWIPKLVEAQEALIDEALGGS